MGLMAPTLSININKESSGVINQLFFGRSKTIPNDFFFIVIPITK